MIILVKLILAHLIGDFLFQPHQWVMDKEEKKLESVRLYLHQNISIQMASVFTEERIIFPTAFIAIITPASIAMKVLISRWAVETGDEDEVSLQSTGKYMGHPGKAIYAGICNDRPLGSCRISNRSKICFSVWRSEGIEGQEINRIYFNRNTIEFWNCNCNRIDSAANNVIPETITG
ncbi:MAG: DUF3307 domain-containing protein [Saprospiraceae bacterium]